MRGQLSRWYTGLWQVAVYHRIPFGGQRVDAEFALIAGEALLFSTLLLLMPLWLVGRPALAAYYLVFDQMLWLALASGVAIRQRRVDVLVYAPLFIVPRILNCLVFLAAFVRIVVLRRQSPQWFSPPRYVSPRSSVLPLPREGTDA